MPSAGGYGSRRAILYARVSTEEQARSGYSLAQQLEALREYAAREGYEVLEEVADPGQSGASLERPGMDRVRDLAPEERHRVYRMLGVRAVAHVDGTLEVDGALAGPIGVSKGETAPS